MSNRGLRLVGGDNPFGAPSAPGVLTDPELEQALIALVMADNTNLDKIGALTPDDLSQHFLGQVLSRALDLRESGSPVNLVTLKADLSGVHLKEGTGLEALRKLSYGETLPPVGEVASKLKDLAQRRSLRREFERLSQATTDLDLSVSDLTSQCIQEMSKRELAQGNAEGTSFRFREGADKFIEWLQSGDAPVEISTGLKDLDEATGGWHRGEFAILAGRPSMGKSAVALASSIRTAKSGVGVLFFSLEMTEKQLVARALADFSYERRSPLAYSRLKPSLVQVEDVDRLYGAANELAELPIEFETRASMTVGEIIARARKAAEEFAAQRTPLGLIVVDHLLKVKPSDRYAGNSVKELDEISEGMCVLAKSLNVAVLGLHQLNRQVESRENQRPVLSDLRGSGSLEQDADAVFFVYRPAYALERFLQDAKEKQKEAEIALDKCKNDLEIQIAKQRNGQTKTLEFFVDMRANVVRDKVRDEVIYSLHGRD